MCWYINLFRSKVEENVGGRIILFLISFIIKKPNQQRKTFHHQKRWQLNKTLFRQNTNKLKEVEDHFSKANIYLWLTDAERLREGKELSYFVLYFQTE